MEVPPDSRIEKSLNLVRQQYRRHPVVNGCHQRRQGRRRHHGITETQVPFPGLPQSGNPQVVVLSVLKLIRNLEIIIVFGYIWRGSQVQIGLSSSAWYPARQARLLQLPGQLGIIHAFVGPIEGYHIEDFTAEWDTSQIPLQLSLLASTSSALSISDGILFSGSFIWILSAADFFPLKC